MVYYTLELGTHKVRAFWSWLCVVCVHAHTCWAKYRKCGWGLWGGRGGRVVEGWN